MASKIFFTSFFIIVFLFGISIVSATECNGIGDVTETQYCEVTGNYVDFLAEGSECLNNYECRGQSCVEGICKGRFASVEGRTDTFEDIWQFFSGEECNPLEDTDYMCEGTIASLCGANGAWEEKGEVLGVCGVSDPDPYTNPENGGNSGSSGIKIIIISPREGIYSTSEILLDVKDRSHQARYWRYSLNGADKEEFSPSTIINAPIGNNVLNVFGSRYSSFNSEKEAQVDFSVVSFRTGLCGDGVCNEGESFSNCGTDCGPRRGVSFCGDGTCNSDESSSDCSADCVAKSVKSRMGLFYALAIFLFTGMGFVGFFIYRQVRRLSVGTSITPKAFYKKTV